MSLIPSTRAEKVAFFNSKVGLWTTNAVAIGTTTTAVTDLQTKVTAAETKLAQQVAAEEAAKAATQAANDAVWAMARAGGDIIKSIRAKAAVAGNSVYELAQIPPPGLPEPIGSLGTPHDFRVALGGDGALTLRWKCSSPRATGVIYQVFRSLDGGREFAYVGASGLKMFIDPTVPAGSASILYRLQAVRSTAVGPWATFTVLIGTGAGGQATASLAPAKLAA